MSQYCNILRSRSPEDVLAVEVLRYDSAEILEGEFNGAALTQSFSFAEELEGEAGGEAPAGDPYSDYTTISDDTGAISVEVPNEWTDVDGRPFTDEAIGEVLDVRAAPDLAALGDGWDVPGVIVSAAAGYAGLGEDGVRVSVGDFSTVCTYGGRQPYEDPLYVGEYDLFTDCGGTTSSYVVVAAFPEDRSFGIRVQVQVVGDRDLDALDRILNSCQVLRRPVVTRQRGT